MSDYYEMLEKAWGDMSQEDKEKFLSGKVYESPIKEDGEKREFTLNEMIEAYNAGEAAGDFDRQRKQRGALFNEYFKTKFRIDVRRGKKII